MKTIRYALIGFGGIAETRIAREGFAVSAGHLAPLPGVALAAATDRNPARRGAVEELGLQWHETSDSILADPGIDAVFIATANASHAPLAMAALNAGKHCLIEKPIATRVADAEALVARARDRGLSLAVDHMMIHNVFNRQARKMIAAGALGTVNDLCLHMEFLYGATAAEAATWRCADPAELGGPLGDVASHCFYMAEFLLDSRIVSLACTYHPRTMAIAAESGAIVKFLLANGIGGSVRVSFAEPRGGLAGTLGNLGYEIYGADATLRAYAALFQLSGHPGEPVKIRLELDDGQRVRRIKPGRPCNIYQEVIRAHARSIRDRRPLTGGDAIHNLRLVVAAHASAASGGANLAVGS